MKYKNLGYILPKKCQKGVAHLGVPHPCYKRLVFRYLLFSELKIEIIVTP